MTDMLDIELTLDDIKQMDPAHILSIHEKLRQTRSEIAAQRDAQNKLILMRDAELAEARDVARRLQAHCTTRDAALSKLALLLIDRGVLGALSLDTAPEEG